MKTKSNTINPKKPLTYDEEENNLPGYPAYPSSEDIYSNYQEESEINPEDISKTKEFVNRHSGATGHLTDYDDVPGSDLDIPGSELDDSMEFIGSEDEENNYYSLGGDDHIDLEEDQGE